MVIGSDSLNGLSVNRAICYGMPHLGAHYETNSVNSHRINSHAFCAVCGKRAAHAHHEPAKGMGAGKSIFRIDCMSDFDTNSDSISISTFVLMPALIALCPQCHADRHSFTLRFQWVFDNDNLTEQWLTGKLLKDGIEPHSSLLYQYGHWCIYNGGILIKEVRKCI